MIHLNVNDKSYELEREPLEARLQEAIAAQVEKMSELNGFLRSTIKSTAEIFLIQLGHKVPKGVDKLEYLAAYVLHMALNGLENKPLHLTAKEVNLDERQAIAD